MKTHLSDHLKTEEVLVVTRAKKQNLKPKQNAVPGVGRMGVRPLCVGFKAPRDHKTAKSASWMSLEYAEYLEAASQESASG